VTVVPLPPRGEWLADARDGDRALRVSWHQEHGCAVVSTWRDGECTGTARLRPAEVARLVGVLTAALAEAAEAAETAVLPPTATADGA
jgi:hypothetical protein